MSKGKKKAEGIIKGALMLATWAELFKKEVIRQFETDLKDRDKKEIIKQRVDKVIGDFINEELSSKLIEVFKEIIKEEFSKPLWLKLVIAITEVVAVSSAGYSLTYWDKLPSVIKISLLVYILGVFISLAISKALKS